MKKILTALLLFASFGASAQTWKNFNASALQYKVIGIGDTIWRFTGYSGNKPFNPDGGGSADSSVFRTKNNSYSLAGMQTKLNGYVPTTRLVSTSNGVLGGGNLGSNLALSSDTTYNRTVANSLTLAQLQTKFNTKQGTITLTTTGSSGAATLIGNTLNIPQYTGGGGGSVTSVTSADGNITVANTTTTPVLTLNAGTSANQVVLRRSDAGLGWSYIYNWINTNPGGAPYDMQFFSGGTSSAGGYSFFTESGDLKASILANGNIQVKNLDTDGSAPSTSGTVRMVTTDGNGQLSFQAIPSGSGVSSVSAGLGMSFTTITSTGSVGVDTTVVRTVANSRTLAQTQTALNAKQATLVSGTNIKTVNGNSLLGSGDVTINSATSGTYSPTVSNIGNTSSLSATYAAYTRIGDIATADVIINFTTTNGGVDSQIAVTLPFDVCSNDAVTGVASVLASNEAGTVDYSDNTHVRVYFKANAATGARIAHIRFTYTVTD